MNDLVPLGFRVEEARAERPITPAQTPAVAFSASLVRLRSRGYLPATHDLQLMLLDMLPIGILVIDERRQILLSNRIAEEIMASGDPILASHDGAVRVYDRVGQTAFATFVRSVFSSSSTDRGQAVHVVLREKRASPVTVTATRCDQCVLSEGGGQAKALLCLRDPLRSPSLNGDTLRVFFKFTLAESGLVGALLAGKTLREYSEQRGVTLNTVRTQLKSVLGKTGLRRQADLVRVLGPI